MNLTRQNAHKFVGELLSSEGSRHYYPLKVIKHSNGNYYAVDRFGVMMEVPDETEPGINQISFDYVVTVEPGDERFLADI